MFFSPIVALRTGCAGLAETLETRAMTGFWPRIRRLLLLAEFAGAPPWKISKIRSSRIVLRSRSVYLIGMITLRQLRYLSALAKHGHFGRAAEACSVTQP